MEAHKATRRKWLRLGVLVAVVVMAFSIAAIAYRELNETPESRKQTAIRLQTIGLPPIDRIEILSLGELSEQATADDFPIRPYGQSSFTPVINRKTVVGQVAQNLANLWRSLNFGGGGALCHEPPYALRFFRGTTLVFETSICWECDNFFIADGLGGYRWVGFFDENQHLLHTLQELLPLPDRKPQQMPP